KLLNRRTYQELAFEGLDLTFSGERYVLPQPALTRLAGDVAIAPVAGPVWPMKGWAYYDQLKAELEATGLRVNVLPRRNSLLEHMGDVSNHRCLVGGDSLPQSPDELRPQRRRVSGPGACRPLRGRQPHRRKRA